MRLLEGSMMGFEYLLIVLLNFSPCLTSQNMITHIKKAEDVEISSHNYPKAYPRDLNLTWEWSVSKGLWAVVFKDFDLWSTDTLQIGDRYGTPVQYNSFNAPKIILPYKSQGPDLFINFISSRTTDKSQLNHRGFKLKILYSRDEGDRTLKIFEAQNEDKKKDDDDSSSSDLHTTILIALTTSIIAILVVIVGAIIVVRRLRQHNKNQRDSFGVRRNSGISHSRRSNRSQQSNGSPQNNHRPQHQHRHEPPHHQQQQEQEGRRPSGLQRSNSQMSWITRAEMNTSIQTAGRTPRPNIYTPAVGAGTETSVKTGARVGRSASEGNDDHSGRAPGASGSQAAGRRRCTIDSTGTRNGIRYAADGVVSALGSGANDRVGQGGRRLRSKPTSPIRLMNQRAQNANGFAVENNSARGNENLCIEGYEDTVDSLNPRNDVFDTSFADVSLQEEPPSYADSVSGNDLNTSVVSNLQVLLPVNKPSPSPSTDVCYDNLALKNTKADMSTSSCQASSDTYVNSELLKTSQSNNSLGEYPVGNALNVVRDDNVYINYSAGIEDAGSTEREQSNVPMNNSDSVPVSKSDTKTALDIVPAPTSSVQIVDGYAYLVTDSSQTVQQKNNAASDWSVKCTTSIQFDIVPNTVRASQLAGEHGYIAMETNGEADSSIYVNTKQGELKD